MFSKLGISFVNNAESQSKSKIRPILEEDQIIDLASMKTFKDRMKTVSSFIASYNPEAISTPFKGTDLKLTKDEKTVIFGSKDGRLAKLNMETKDIVLDTHIDDKAIWTIELSKDESLVYVGGQHQTIKCFNFHTFELAGKFSGHKSDVYLIIISSDNKSMYSCSEDGTVKLWDLSTKDTKDSKAKHRDIARHNKAVQAIDLTPDGRYLMTGSIDMSACILTKESGDWAVTSTLINDSPIMAVKISENLRYVVTGDDDGKVIAWDFNEQTKLKVFKDTSSIWCIDVAEDGNFIVTGGKSANIMMWDMAKERRCIELKGHKQMIKSAVITADQKNVVSLSNDSKVMKWKIPNFEERTVIHTSRAVTKLWFSNENGLLYAYMTVKEDSSTKYMINAWNLINYTLVKEFPINEPNIIDFYKGPTDKYMYFISHVDGIYTVTSYDLIEGLKISTYPLGRIEFVSFSVSLDNQYLFIGQTFKILTFRLGEKATIYNWQIYHGGKVNKIVCTSNNKYILSADSLNVVKLIDVELMADENVRNDLEELTMFKDAGSSFIDMKLMNDDIIIIVSYDFTVFWSIDKRTVVKKVDKPNVSDIGFSLDQNYIFFRTGSKIEIWTSSDFSYNCFIQYDENLSSYHISPDNKTIAVSQNDGDILVSRSPLATKTIFLCGNPSEKCQFISYASSIIDDSSEEYNGNFDDWIIEPFHYNLLHLYAFYNFDEYLTLALRRKSPFFCTALGFSPLTIALEADYPNCINAILRELREVFNENPFIFLSIESCLPALNESGYERLHSVYEILFSATKVVGLPKFCSNEPKFPVRVISDSFIPKRESFEPIVAYAEEGKTLEFLQTFVKVPLLAGTSESIEFLQSIEDCKNLRIYDTEFIQTLLQEKWNQIKWVAYLQAIAYIVFLVLLSLYTVEYRDKDFLVAPFVVNCLFCAYELSYLASSKAKYFQDPWNYIDITRIFAFLIYAVLIWVNVLPDEDGFLAALILISWVRGVAYFRIFKQTRYLINLLITSCRDIAAFLVILFYSTISFALIFYALLPYKDENGNTIDDFFVYATSFYDLNLGNSNVEGFGKLEWGFYVLVTILNPIIMINLLISILGDTYGTASENESVNDARELIKLIFEAELLMFWRRNAIDRKYIHVCDELEPVFTEQEDLQKRKIKMLKSRVVGMTENMKKEEQIIFEMIRLIQVRNAAVSDLIEDYEYKKAIK